ALSAEVAAGDAITIHDGEGEAVLKWAKGNHGPWIEDNPGRMEKGRLMLRQREPAVLALYGASAFSVRFGQSWPVLDLGADDEDDEAGALSVPVQGKKILETPGGRIYFATMALLLS